MIKNKLKRVLAVALAGMMVAGVAGCSSSKDAKKNNTAKSEQGTEATTESKANTTADYVASNVTLPDNFDNMIYPIEALMVQKLSKGYHITRTTRAKKKQIPSGFPWQFSHP